MAKAKRSATRKAEEAAMRGGREEGRAAVQARTIQARRRAVALRALERKPAPRRAPTAAPSLPKSTRALLGSSKNAGVLIAEGDSWFDYPRHDVLKMLEDEHLYDIHSVAHKGDCVEDMAHSGGQFEDFARRLEKLLRDNKIPKAILLSGGGNDIAGDEFALLLNHAASSLPILNEDILRGVIDVRLRTAYIRIISGITEITQSYLGKALPIVTHGYDYALPDGRGFLGGVWFLPGPWLEPGFNKKGYDDFRANALVVRQLMKRFNDMLQGLSGLPQFPHVHYLNLLGTLESDVDKDPKKYKQHWENELHPNEAGFRLVADKFAKMIGGF